MKKLYSISLILLLFASLSFGQDATNRFKFSGLMFGDYFYNSDNVTPANVNMNGFQFRRIYFTTDIFVAEKFDARFRVESDQGAGSLTAGGKLGVMVKDAYLKWKGIFSGSDMLFGISPTPAFDISEGAWGYRSLEKTIMDLNGIVPSRDFGVDLKGKIADNGSVNYWVKVANNSGNGPETDKYKRYYALLQFKPVDGFQATIYGDYAVKADVVDKVDGATKSNNGFVGALFLNYQQKSDFAIGVETFIRSQQNNFAATATSTLQNQNSFGISVWAWASLSEDFRLVGRFDNYDPNQDKDNDAVSMILAGLDWRVAKNVSIIPNIQVFSYQGNSDHKNVSERVTFSFTF